jgi:hypothetical protein
MKGKTADTFTNHENRGLSSVEYAKEEFPEIDLENIES